MEYSLALYSKLPLEKPGAFSPRSVLKTASKLCESAFPRQAYWARKWREPHGVSLRWRSASIMHQL